MPVGIMCFRGLSLHYEDIVKLLEHAPATQLVIDHLGFFLQGERGVVSSIDYLALVCRRCQLLSLSRIPAVTCRDYPRTEAPH